MTDPWQQHQPVPPPWASAQGSVWPQQPPTGPFPADGVARRSKTPWVIGFSLLVVGLIAAVAMALGGFVTAASDTDGHQFGSDQPTTVHLVAGQSQTLYVNDPAGASDGTCKLLGAGVHVDTFHGGVTVNQWRAALTLSADSTGDYQLTCSGSDGVSYRVGDDAGVAIMVGVLGGFLGGAVAFAGLIVLIVTAIRRRSAPVPAARYPYPQPYPNAVPGYPPAAGPAGQSGPRYPQP